MKTYKSASLTFYDYKNGLLIANEYRYREKKYLFHPIGGKVDEFDKDIFYTAIREFIEETNLIKNMNINIKNLEIKGLIEKIYEKLNSIKLKKIDLCVNKKLNYYHKYFVINLKEIEDIEFKKEIINLPIFFNDNYKTELNYLRWYNLNIKERDISWLLKILINKYNKNKINKYKYK